MKIKTKINLTEFQLNIILEALNTQKENLKKLEDNEPKINHKAESVLENTELQGKILEIEAVCMMLTTPYIPLEKIDIYRNSDNEKLILDLLQSEREIQQKKLNILVDNNKEDESLNVQDYLEMIEDTIGIIKFPR